MKTWWEVRNGEDPWQVVETKEAAEAFTTKREVTVVRKPLDDDVVTRNDARRLLYRLLQSRARHQILTMQEKNLDEVSLFTVGITGTDIATVQLWATELIERCLDQPDEADPPTEAA